jgi:hypothetical protein
MLERFQVKARAIAKSSRQLFIIIDAEADGWL